MNEVLLILIDGGHIIDQQICDMRNTIGFIIEKTNLQDENNTLIELKVFGAIQNVELANLIE